MRKCTGNNWQEWTAESLHEQACPDCGHEIEFFMDEITRNCPKCGRTVKSNRTFFGCGRWCSADSEYRRNQCPKFKQSKVRFYGTNTPDRLY